MVRRKSNAETAKSISVSKSESETNIPPKPRRRSERRRMCIKSKQQKRRYEILEQLFEKAWAEMINELDEQCRASSIWMLIMRDAFEKDFGVLLDALVDTQTIEEIRAVLENIEENDDLIFLDRIKEKAEENEYNLISDILTIRRSLRKEEKAYFLLIHQEIIRKSSMFL
ncbi:MAG TPA: hypothetical protein VKR06_35640 [Ktedonosporobacter sp.]|nr:hypothetical protein [Ktedonosporobacter sp.]